MARVAVRDGSSLRPAAGRNGRLRPPVETYTKDNMFYMTVELPGVELKDIQIELVDNLLWIRGEKKVEKKIEEKYLFHQEIAHGKFERCFGLPEGIKADDVKATFNNGVLELVLPATGRMLAQKVPIQIGAKGTREIKVA